MKQQRGAAILIAMLVVTLVATFAAGLQWRQWRALQQETAARAQSQANWVLIGALDWARLILREDARSASNGIAVDHLGEPWALPLQEVKLSSFLSADSLAQEGQDEAYLSGQITDAQAKINLTNLVVDGKLSKPAYQKLNRLYQKLQLPTAELQQWTELWLTQPLRPLQVKDLSWLAVPPRSIAALEPFVTILPTPTPVNLNTASAEVIYAVIDDLDFAQAQRWVMNRTKSPLQSLAQATQVLGMSLQASPLDNTALSVSSNFFEVKGRLRLGDWLISEQSLVQRTGIDVKALHRQKF